MNKVLEFVLTALALAGMYCAVSKPAAPLGNPSQAEQAVVIADGSDPMPLCRRCSSTK
jgi:hypothetical protein